MKLLLDENIPFNLYKDFPPQHPAFSVNYMNIMHFPANSLAE